MGFFFTSKSEREKLQDKYRKLTAEAHKLSQVNRKAGDAKLAEAEEVMKKIEQVPG